MLSNIECPYCASCESTLIRNFYSTILNAKTSVYQCGQCLNLFDYPRDVKRLELQKRLSDLQQEAEEQTAVALAANAIGKLNNEELASDITKIQRNSLINQLNLIRQRILATNLEDQELLNKLQELEVDIQAKLIELQKRELQRRLSDLQEDAQEQISIIGSSGFLPGTGDELQVLKIVYGYNNLGNRVPLDSFWATFSEFRLSNLEYETPTNLDNSTNSANNSFLVLLKLLFGVFQIIFSIWLFYLAFSF